MAQNPLSGPLNDFTCSLFHRLSLESGQENVFASPLSVGTALSMLMLGAKNKSLTQLKQGMRMDSQDDASIHNLFQNVISDRFKSDPGLALANYLLVQKEQQENEVLQKYKSDLKSLYSAEADDVDFAADGSKIMKTVNDWVKENTKNLIETILSEPPGADTKLILLNAIYFKGKWEKPFDKDMTTKINFFNRGADEFETDFMIKYRKKYQYASAEVGGQKVQMIELPYEDETTGMVIILPEKTNGLKDMIGNEKLEADLKNVLSLDSTIEFRSEEVNIFIPKFKFETEYNLNETLTKMGIADIFTTRADLSGISGRKDLLVSLIKHKAMVKVDEEGTEAAAATMVIMARMCALSRHEPINFRADHPFLFAIRDKKTGLVLFIGKVEAF